MIAIDQIQTLLTGGGNVVDSSGEKIGTIGEVYLDDQTEEPEWVTVKTGVFGRSESFIPLAQASAAGAELRVPYDKDLVKSAPQIESDGHLSQDQERSLYEHYGLRYAGADVDAGTTVGHDTSGPTTDSAMTRSEERLSVDTERVAASRVRLRKYIVTEQQTITVPVQREEVRLERVPITESTYAGATDGPAITEAEQDIVLHEERIVVTKETVPVERVRLAKQTVTEEQTVTDEVRKERIELEQDGPATTR